MRKLAACMYILMVMASPVMTFPKLAVSEAPDCKDDCNNEYSACMSAANIAYENATQGLEQERDLCLADAESDYDYCSADAWEDWDYCTNIICNGQTACMMQCDAIYYDALDDCLDWWESASWYCEDYYDTEMNQALYFKNAAINVCEIDKASCLNGCAPQAH